MTHLAQAVPALAYLAAVTLALLLARRCPSLLHAAGLATGLAWRVHSQGVVPAALGLAAGTVAFLLLAAVARRMLSSVGLLAVSVSVALLPFPDWAGLAFGAALAGAVATALTLRSGGKDRVAMLAGETLSAMGVSPSGLSRPDMGLLPAARDLPSAAPSRRLYLPPFLFAGVAAWAALRGVL